MNFRVRALLGCLPLLVCAAFAGDLVPIPDCRIDFAVAVKDHGAAPDILQGRAYYVKGAARIVYDCAGDTAAIELDANRTLARMWGATEKLPTGGVPLERDSVPQEVAFLTPCGRLQVLNNAMNKRGNFEKAEVEQQANPQAGTSTTTLTLPSVNAAGGVTFTPTWTIRKEAHRVIESALWVKRSDGETLNGSTAKMWGANPADGLPRYIEQAMWDSPKMEPAEARLYDIQVNKVTLLRDATTLDAAAADEKLPEEKEVPLPTCPARTSNLKAGS